MARKLEVEIVGDASSLERAFGKASHAGSGFGSAIGKVAKAAALGTAALGAGMAAGIGIGIKSLMEHEKADARLANVLKTTGNAANTNVKSIAALANAMEKKSGIDDVLIKSGAGLLLTFKNIQNAAGKGNDMFDQSVKISNDLSVALGKDLQSSALMVGKALNDPIKGLTALGRAGVQFTEGQKEQIKAMVESGNVMGAQKLIMAELTSQVGGAAEALGGTMAGRLNILKARLEEVAESVAAKVLPLFERLVAWVEGNWPTIQRVVETVFAAVGTAISTLVDIVRPIIEAIIGSFRDMQSSGSDLQSSARSVFSSIGDFLRSLWRVAEPVFSAIRDIIANVVIPIFREIWDIAQEAFEGISRVLQDHEPEISRIMEAIGTVMRTLGTIIREVVENVIAPILRFVFGEVLPLVIGTAITAINLVIVAFQGMGTAVDTVVKAVQLAVTTAWNAVSTVTTTVWGAVSSAIGTTVGNIRTAVETAVEAVRAAVKIAWDAISLVTTTVWNAVETKVKTVINAVKTVVTTVVGDVRTAVATAWNAISTKTSEVWEDVRKAVATAIGAVKERVTTIAGDVREAIFTAWDRVIEKTRTVWDAVLKKIRDVMGDALTAVKNLINDFFSAAADIGRAIVNGVISGLGSLASRIRDAVEGGIRSALNSINPFSPIEVGAARLIGQPIVEGAIDGVAGMAKELRRTLESQVGGALRSATFGSLALPTPALSMGASFTGGGEAGTAMAGGGGFIGSAFGPQEITIRVPVTLDGRTLTEVVYQGLLDRSRSSGSLFTASPGVRL